MLYCSHSFKTRSKKLNSNVKIWLVFKLLKSISTGAEAGLKFCDFSNMSDDVHNNFLCKRKVALEKNEPYAPLKTLENHRFSDVFGG